MKNVRLHTKGALPADLLARFDLAGYLFLGMRDLGTGWFESTFRGPGPGTMPLKRRLAERDGGYRCVYCHRFLDPGELTIDHFIPRSRGGRDDDDNLFLACASCNQEKGSQLYRHPHERSESQRQPR